MEVGIQFKRRKPLAILIVIFGVILGLICESGLVTHFLGKIFGLYDEHSETSREINNSTATTPTKKSKHTFNQTFRSKKKQTEI